MEQADGVMLRIIGAEGVGADELGRVARMVRGGFFVRAHFVEDDGDSCVCGLPCGFGACESCAYNMNYVFRHGRGLAKACVFYKYLLFLFLISALQSDIHFKNYFS